MRCTAILAVIGACMAPSSLSAQSDEAWACGSRDVFSPTQVANAFWEKLSGADPREKQLAIVSAYYCHVSSDDTGEELSRLDQLALGEGAFLSFNGHKAFGFFEPLKPGDDLIAEHAWQRVMQITFRGFGEIDRAADLLLRYSEKFPPSEKNIRGRSQAIGNFIELHIANGNKDAAVSMLADEISSLPGDAPYFSFGLPMRFSDLIDQSDRKQEIVELVRAKRDNLRQLKSEWDVEPYLADEDPILTQEMPRWYWKSQGVMLGESLRSARKRQLSGLLNALDGWLDRRIR